MPRYRAGAYDRGSRVKGRYTVVEARSLADAMLEVRKFFPGVPIARIFAQEAELYDKIDNNLHPFTLPKKPKGTR